MVQTKHPNEPQTGDQVSSYGKANIPGQKGGPVLGHHPACSSSTDQKFGCSDMVKQNGLGDTQAHKGPKKPRSIRVRQDLNNLVRRREVLRRELEKKGVNYDGLFVRSVSEEWDF